MCGFLLPVFSWSFYIHKYCTLGHILCVLILQLWSLQRHWQSSPCVVPGPGASIFCWRSRRLQSSFLHILGRWLCASTRMGKPTIPPPGCVSCMSTPPPTKSTFRISSCIMMNCQYRHSRDLRTSIPLFTTVPASNCQIPADPSLAFRGFADKIKRSVFASRFFPVHSRQYEGTRRRERDCL
jgi:hypothetical protein